MSQLLHYLLSEEGYDVRCFAKGEELLDALIADIPGLILLDLMLPGISGLEVCKAIKSNKRYWDIPILILSSRDDEFDEITGFNLGCDDYVTKPFSEKILIARIKASFLRSQKRLQSVSKVLKVGNLMIDEDRHEISINGKIKTFTALEFKVLYVLVLNSGKVFSREKIFDEIYDSYSDSSERSIDIIIARVRKKLGSYSKYLQSVYGVGYTFKI